MTDKTKQPTKRERALSAWESATARNLNPKLNDDQAKKLWDAVIAQREKPNAGEFEKAALAAIGNVSSGIGPVVAACVANLREVLAIDEAAGEE